MSKVQLRKKLFELLPLDDESLDQIIDYSLTLGSNDEIANHFIGLIGESPLLFDFIQKLTSFKDASSESYTKYVKPEITSKSQKKPSNDKPKKTTSQNPWGKSIADNVRGGNSSSSSSSKPRLANSKGATAVSDLLDELPSSKAKKKQEERKAEHVKANKAQTKTQKLNDINDLDKILRNLEYGGAGANVKCDCMAARHGLNKAIPNCLNCGKIVCKKESGRTNCSFCGEPLISLNEKLEMIKLIRQEKEKLMSDANKSAVSSSSEAKKKKKEKITIGMGAGSKNFFREQDRLFKNLENKQKEAQQLNIDKLSSDKEKAESTLNTLLGYQENSTQRTKIIDQVSDYALPDETNIWTKSSLDKVLELKKQQRNLRKKEKLEAERGGKGQKFIELNVKGGKVVLTEKSKIRAPDSYASDFNSDSANDNDDGDDLYLDSEDEQMKEDIKKIKAKIQKEAKAQEKELMKKNWDYSQDLEKWKDRKPRYVGTISVVAAGDDTEVEKGEKYSKIQLGSSKDAPIEELLVDL